MPFMFLAVIDDTAKEEDFLFIYHKYKKMVFKIADSILENPSDSEEAAQETWFAISENMSSIAVDNEERTERYIRKAAESQCFIILRKNKKIPKTVEMSVLCSIPSDENIEANLEVEEEVGKVIKCITSMPKAYRDALTLFYLDKLSPTKMAKLLGEPISTVKSRLRRGNKILEKTIKEMKLDD